MLKLARGSPCPQGRGKEAWGAGEVGKTQKKAKDGLCQESAALKGGGEVGKDDLREELLLCICKGNFFFF